MFSFHKPKVYRSTSGCCICRAKSSSSRFTDSRKYEDDFQPCFKLNELRRGDICNACVLLVKRWKKLPFGSKRNWQHVVDARAGCGNKPMSKINKVKKTKKSSESEAKQRLQGVNQQDSIGHDGKQKGDIESECILEGQSKTLSMDSFGRLVGDEAIGTPSVQSLSQDDKMPTVQDSSIICNEKLNNMQKFEDKLSGSGRRKRNRSYSHNKRHDLPPLPFRDGNNDSFLDLSFWKTEKTCCGTVYTGQYGELILDTRLMTPCACRSDGESIRSSGDDKSNTSDDTELSISNVDETSAFDEIDESESQ